MMTFVWILKRSQFLPWWYIAIIGWFTFVSIPNSLYLFLEIKHLIFKDGVADGGEYEAVFAFIAMSILGLVCAIWTILIAVRGIPVLSQNQMIAIVVLSFLIAIGSVFGLLDVASLVGFLFPPIIGYLLMEVLTSEKLLLLTGGLTVMLTVTTVVANWFF